MKGLVVAISGILTIVYLGAIFEASQRTQAQRRWAIANEEEHTRAVSLSKGEAFKAGSKTPGVLLAQNKKLSDKLSALLRQQNPPVTDLQAASQGFKVLTQFVATVHVSQNLGIPFDQLKTAAQTSRSLNKAIHLLKPDAYVEGEVREAMLQALDDLDMTPGVLLTQNKKLSDKLSALLGQQNPPVTDLQVASHGFMNLGELFAAVHISQNMGIPFDQLKTAVQTNGNLGKAIHPLKPDEHVEGEVRKAVLQALDDLDMTPGVLLAQHKQLSGKLSAFLRQQNPPVTDLQAASQGFMNLGELFTAVHISQNMGIPFDQLKTAMQTNGSLGKAIPAIKPNADTKIELWEAAAQAVGEIEESYWAIAQSSSISM